MWNWNTSILFLFFLYSLYVRKIKIFFNLNLNVLNKVDTLEILIKEMRASLNLQKIRKKSKNKTKKKNMWVVKIKKVKWIV
jgi:hypothetical protein